MKRLLIAALALCGFAFGQVHSDIAIQNTQGNFVKAVPGARIYVCNSSATTTQCLQGVAGGQTITVYTDSNLSVTTTQPITADSSGNYTVFANPGIYLECVIASATYCRKIQIASSASGGVTSFNSRTGAVTTQSGDYTWGQIGAGSNLNAQSMGTGGTFKPLNIGQVASSQVWLHETAGKQV
jgi:hypothetical protein